MRTWGVVGSVVAAMACDSGALGPLPGPDAPPTAPGPRVVTTIPPPDAVAVMRDTAVSATFSQDMAAASLDATTFGLVCGGAPVAGSIAYDVPTRTATFTPPLPLSLRATCTATLTTGVTSADATPLPEPSAWTFAVRDGAWVDATLVEAGPVERYAPRLGIDAAGRVLLVWAQGGIIWQRRFVAGAGWGGVAALAGDGASAPDLAVNAQGNAVVIWMRANKELWTRAYRADAGWGAPTLLAASRYGVGYAARVALADDGSALAVWKQFDEDYPGDLWARRFVPASGWSAPVRLESEPTPIGIPGLAMNARGEAIVVWAQGEIARNSVRSRRFEPGTGWAPVIRVQAGSSYLPPQVRLDPDGNALVVWLEEVAADQQVWASRQIRGGDWGPSTLLDRDGAVMSVALGMDADGRAIAAWSATARLGGIAPVDVRTRRFTPAAGWGAIVTAEDSSTPAIMPDVAMSPDGAAVLAWLQLVDDTIQGWTRHFSPDVGWAAVADMHVEAPRDPQGMLAPELAAGSSGDVAVAWMLRPDVDAGERLQLWASVHR